MTLDIVDAFTVEAWIKPDLIQNSFNGSFGNIFHSASAGCQTGDFCGIVLWIANNLVYLTVGLNGTPVHLSAEAVLPTDRFTHIAATYNNGTARIYLDSRKVLENNGFGSFTRMTSPNAYFSIGADRNGPNAFIGAIDEVRVSNVAREF